MKRSLTVTLLLLAACGQPVQDDGAALSLDVRFKAPTVFPHAEKPVEQQLKEITPSKLRIMVCDHVRLTEQVNNYCSAEKNDYNYIETVSLSSNSGTAVLYDVPSGTNQIIVAQGLDAAESVTYQGFFTQAVIAPRGRYVIGLELAQVKFPELPPPPAPELTNTSFEVPANVYEFTFTGTREAGTILKAILPAAFNLGTTPVFSQTTGSYYKESTSGDTTTWELKVNVPPRPQNTPRSFPVSFSASRMGTDKFGEPASVSLKACADDGAGGQICG